MNHQHSFQQRVIRCMILATTLAMMLSLIIMEVSVPTPLPLEVLRPFAVPDQFHALAHEKIRRLVHAQNIISWPKTTDKFFQEINITALMPELNIERLHGRSDKQNVWKNTSQHYVWETNICFAARGFAQAGKVKKHVLFTYLNENRGAFSRDIPNRTAIWDHLATHWSSWGCTDQEIFDYLNHHNTLAVFTTQHHSYQHAKAYSLPLGVQYRMKAQVLAKLQLSPQRRTQLLMINDNGWRHRAQIAQAVNASFDYTLHNTYTNKGCDAYLDELRHSKFISAPSGLGIDCYRIWDALYMGAIPIIERYDRPKDGWRKTLQGLPVLFVEHLEDVTPKLLNQKYLEITSQPYDYEKLTLNWWVDFVKSFVPHDMEQS